MGFFRLDNIWMWALIGAGYFGYKYLMKDNTTAIPIGKCVRNPAEKSDFLRYDPSINRYNGQKLTRGDVLIDTKGNQYVLDRANGFMLTLDKRNSKGGTDSFSVSVDPFDKIRYMDLKLTGENLYGAIPNKTIPMKPSNPTNKNLTEAEMLAEMNRVKQYFPYRIIYGVIDKDTGEFVASASLDMRRPNKLARQGHKVLLLKRGNPIEKESWQMTSGEYSEFKGISNKLRRSGKITIDKKGRPHTGKNYSNYNKKLTSLSESEHNLAVRQALSAGKPVSNHILIESMQSDATLYTRDEILAAANERDPMQAILNRKSLVESHKKIIQDALSKGKKISPEVLKDYPDLSTKSMQSNPNTQSDEEFLTARLAGGHVSAYSTVHFTKSQNNLLKKWVRQGKVIKQQNAFWTGPGNKYNYWLVR